MKRRKVLVLTGKRGGFGAMKTMLRSLRANPDVELQLVVTDQHLDPTFGRTIAEVQQEFQVAAQVEMLQQGDSCHARAEALGRCAAGLSQTFAELKPDICVLYGDRGESLAAALVCTTLNIPIAHIQGGDLSGSVDEVMRHAITKLAQLHLTSNPASAERLARMGEDGWRIHVVGDAHLDPIVAGEYADPDTVAREFGLDPSSPIIVALQHSETTAPEDSYAQMIETLLAVRDTSHQAVVVYPCSDPGYGGVVRAIDEIALPPQFRVHRNIPAPLFVGLLKISSVLVGNSSAGLIETPALRVPAVNIGRRQVGRIAAENVIHVSHDRTVIARAISVCLSDEFAPVVASCSQLYGDGHAGKRIAEILATAPLDRRLLVKQMTY